MLFSCMLGGMFLFSSVFLFMPIASKAGLDGNQIPFIVLGAAFWLTLIVSYTLLFILNRSRRKNGGSVTGIKSWGCLRICSNRLAIVADTASIVSLIVFGILIFTGQNSYIVYVFLSILVFSLQMHGVLNGENFKYLFSVINKPNGGRTNE